MAIIDWSSFTRKLNIITNTDKLFKFWTTPVEIEKWFLQEANFFTNGVLKQKEERINKGDTYKWKWYTSDMIAEGEVLDIKETDYLKFTFLGCEVEIKIAEEYGEQILTLTQSKIETDDDSKLGTYVECTRGWTFYMTNLKSILEGGIDLRNKNNQIKNMLST